ncbi:MAG: HlyD family secretion protein, partial [Rhodospirillales bacterium]|nr:HlyD family secretion protein [Rhodospirillales bacterium]
DLPPDERRTRAGAIRRNLGERIAGVLTPEQLPRFRALRSAQGSTGSAAGQIWVLGPDGQPKTVSVRLGIGDGAFTEVIGGALQAGQEIIVGSGRATAAAATPRLGF